MDRQAKCNGCRRIEALVRYCDEKLSADAKSTPVRFHHSYSELSTCAKHCSSCRVMRQAFIQNQATFDQVKELEETTRQLPVWATVDHRKLRLLLGASSGIGGESLANTAIEDQVCAQIRNWAQDCDNHPICGNLSSSRRNPTRLIKILSDSQVQIVDSRLESLVPYVALSYCWEDPNKRMSTHKSVKESRTMGNNLARRKLPFPINALRKSIQDAIHVAKRAGTQYIWIDSICIIQDSAEDWMAEAALMAEVYSNAYFTLCLVAVAHADAPLMEAREAWRYPVEPCQLNGRNLSALSLPLRDLKQRSRWSTRAWTLQEERLSPRILYWTSQRMYWSCATQELTEHGSPQRQWPGPDQPSMTQSFLQASYDGIDLHPYWMDVVEDYTRRNLTKSSDRFPALSGLALKYQTSEDDDEYLAGLWRNTIGLDLGWRVDLSTTRHYLSERADGIPSWSWASLPLGTSMKMNRSWVACSSFEFVGFENSELTAIKPRVANATTLIDDGIHKVQRGAHVTSITVRGRVRPLLRENSELRTWSEVVSSHGPAGSFSFASFVDRHIHCVEPHSGQLLVHEAHKKEILYQLDDLKVVSRILSKANELVCLEIGAQTMLLLERSAVTQWG
ncbi:heterokaryon incompatibility protein-domain-containing protein [Astrocystis sublimbata]|nr:heterokaryon incompatibility protein-domain-containing protein [Astrocystis sublimbata]